MKLDNAFSEYNHGYWKALVDLKGLFERTNFRVPDVHERKYKNTFTLKNILNLMDFLIEHHEEFCDGGAFFEFYQGIDNKGNIIYRTLAEHEERR